MLDLKEAGRALVASTKEMSSDRRVRRKSLRAATALINPRYRRHEYVFDRYVTPLRQLGKGIRGVPTWRHRLPRSCCSARSYRLS